jgi:hypothetical protein
MTWLVVALVAVALIAIGAYVMEKQRSAVLRRRFGPEYERALGDADGNRRAAETQLRERLRRRAAVDVRDLEPAVRARYSSRWRALQMGFVDDPAAAVAEAEALVDELVDERGYAATASADDGSADDGSAEDGSDEDRYELVAVDHAVAVEQHRQARGVPDDGPVDDLRQAFLYHRALFEALLGDASEDGDRRRGAGRAVVTESAVVRP